MGDSKRKRREEPREAEPGAVAEGAEPESVSFEGALEHLEQTVARLEEGDMPLEEALELFESGVKLARHCASTLDAAERRVEILVADRGDGFDPDRVEDFEVADDDDEDVLEDYEDEDDDDDLSD